LDIKSLAKNIGMDREDYKELLKLFIESATSNLHRIKESYQQKDFQAIME